MHVRPITPEEFSAANNISTLAFVMKRDKNEPPQQPDAHVNMRAAFDESGRMTASLLVIPYTVHLGTKTVTMGGIGNVASLPESRRQGNIRALFQFILREMYDRGMAISALFPFSHPYYRQFGYELVCTRRKMDVKMERLLAFKPVGTARQYVPGDDDTPIRAIYEHFIRGMNLAPLRDDKLWKQWLDKDPYETRRYTYLWHDDAGDPRAYMILEVADSPAGRELLIADAAFLDLQALLGLFGLLRNMGAQFSTVSWAMPTWVDPFTLLPEPWDVTQTIVPRGMARIINVGDVLRGLPHPEGMGSYALRVSDPYLVENDGVWCVSYDAGKAEISHAREGEADWTLDIPTLTQLALGYLDVDMLLSSRPGVETPKNLDVLRRVFVQRKLYLSEGF